MRVWEGAQAGRAASAAYTLPMSPSPLDRPGLDDPPQREWILDAEDGASLGLADGHAQSTLARVAPVEFRPDSTLTDRELEDARPERRSERNPIAIELVRGANGPGRDADVDEWTVLIDGVRCTSVKRRDETFEDDVDVYHLPLPFDDDRSLYDSRLDGGPSSVRPLAFGVRIEAEALRPAKVELVMEQVVESADTEQRQLGDANASFWLQSGQRCGEEQSVVISSQTLEPYTPLDVVAPCITTPYPLRAPATSALGLLHFDVDENRGPGILTQFKDAAFKMTAAAYEDQQRWDQATELRNEVDRTISHSMMRSAALYESKRQDRRLQLNNEQTRLDSDRNAAIAGIEIPNVDQAQLATRELRNLQPQDVQREWRVKEASIKTVFNNKQIRLDDRKRNFERSGQNAKVRLYVPESPLFRSARVPLRLPNALAAAKPQGNCTILGGNVEAVVDLTTQFGKLDIALKLARQHQVKNRDASAAMPKEQTAVERVNLMRKWLVLTGETKAARLLETLLLSKPNFVDYNRKGADWADANKKTSEEEYNQAPEINDSSSYLLVDRMSFEALRSSNCRVRFRLKVTENGAPTSAREFLFEASAAHGHLANTAYTNAPQKVENLRKQMDAFYEAFMADLRDPSPLVPMWDTALRLLRDVPKDFQFIASAILDYWDRDAAFRRRLDRMSNANREAWASALNTTMQGTTGEIFERAFGATTATGARAITSVGSEAFKVWLQSTAQEADFDRVRETSLYAKNSTVQALRFLTAPGMGGVIKAFLEDVSDSAKDPEYFTEAKIKDGLQSLRGTLHELDNVVQQTLPHSVLHDLGADRGAKLCKDALDAGDDKDALLANIRARADERVAEVQQRRSLYCRMPQIALPTPILPNRFVAAKNDVCMDLDMEDAEVPPRSNNRLFSWIGYGSASALTSRLFFTLFQSYEKQKYTNFATGVREGNGWFGSMGYVVAAAGTALTLMIFGPAGGAAAATGLANVAPIAGSVLNFFTAATANVVLQKTANYLGSSYIAGNERVRVTAEGGMIDQRAADVALQAGTFVFNVIRGYHTAKLARARDGKKKYKECLRMARQNPVEAAVANATQTLKALRVALDVKNDLAAVNGDGTRFRFYERFSVLRIELDALKETLATPHPQSAWNRLPDGLALRFVPPSELVAQVYEGETLRRTPLNAALARVSEMLGAPRSQSGTSLARLSAQRIHTEMQTGVRDNWLMPFPWHPSGAPARRFVGRTGPRTAALLAEHACRLLRAAFAGKTPTLIDEDDVFFDCFAGGGAARLALRHIPTVTQTLDATRARIGRLPPGTPPATAALNAASIEWTPERRSSVDTLCKMWEEVARNSSGMLVSQLDVAKASREALAAFLRVRELSNPKSTGPALATASAMAALHGMVGPDAAPALRTEGLRALAQASAEVEGFRYQDKFQKAAPEHATPLLENRPRGKVAFAARRLDLDAMATAPVGDGVDALVDALGPAELLGSSNATEHYYVACGDNLDFQPSPLLYSGAVAQPVWLQDVVDACSRLLATLSTTPVAVAGTALVQPRSAREPGLARHPLVVTRAGLDGDGEVVGIRLLEQTEAPLTFATPEAESAAASLLGAMALLRSDATEEARQRADLAAAVVRVTTERARVLTFNADRCAAGLALAAGASRTEVNASSGAPSAVEVALGLAMADTASHEVVLRARDPESDRYKLEDLRATCEAALKRGCKAATLAEISLAFMDR